MKKRIEKWLEQFVFVKWDRFCPDGKDITAFGWIEREEDEYKDFIVLYFENGFVNSYMTSSKKYSLLIYQMINKGASKGHTNCRRIEDYFDVSNSIKLGKKVGFIT